ncbi:MAG: DinB family protein [Myxococcota bacterium]
MKLPHRYIDTVPADEFDYALRTYADKVYDGETVVEVLDSTTRAMEEFFRVLPDESLRTRYAPRKWTVAEVIQHLITYERIFLDRIRVALESTAVVSVPFYTQSSTAEGGNVKSKEQLLHEYRDVRRKLEAQIDRLDASELSKGASIDGIRGSIRALVACASGHQRHHFDVIRRRYLKR